MIPVCSRLRLRSVSANSLREEAVSQQVTQLSDSHECQRAVYLVDLTRSQAGGRATGDAGSTSQKSPATNPLQWPRMHADGTCRSAHASCSPHDFYAVVQ